MTTNYNEQSGTNKPSATDTKTNKKIEVVVDEKVVVKPNMFKRIANAIVDPEGFTDIKTNLKDQVKRQAADSVKNIISSGLKGAVDALFYGQSTNYSNYSNPFGKTQYSQYSNGVKRVGNSQPQTRQRKIFNSRRYIIGNEPDAEAVIQALTGQIIEYGSARVADFYNLIDISTDYTDNSYGWTDLSSAGIEAVPNGYVVVLPTPQRL